MENMNPPDGHHGMDMGMMHPPSSGGRHKMMMHMTFFWGTHTEILFSGWPGANPGMYALALIFVFLLAFFIEWLSHSSLIKPEATHLAAGMVQTVLYMLRVGLAYLVMLAVMSFNGGVFLVAVAGHTLGFFLFGSRVFKKNSPLPAKTTSSSLPPTTTC